MDFILDQVRERGIVRIIEDYKNDLEITDKYNRVMEELSRRVYYEYEPDDYTNKSEIVIVDDLQNIKVMYRYYAISLSNGILNYMNSYNILRGFILRNNRETTYASVLIEENILNEYDGSIYKRITYRERFYLYRNFIGID